MKKARTQKQITAIAFILQTMCSLFLLMYDLANTNYTAYTEYTSKHEINVAFITLIVKSILYYAISIAAPILITFALKDNISKRFVPLFYASVPIANFIYSLLCIALYIAIGYSTRTIVYIVVNGLIFNWLIALYYFFVSKTQDKPF